MGQLLTITGLIIFLDQVSKYLILQYVARHGILQGETIYEVTNFLAITYALNTGGVFGLFANKSYLFIILNILALAIILLYLSITRKKNETKHLDLVFLSLICGGAIGNLADRVLRGAVIDFIDLHWKNFHWPAFNIADIAVTVGVCLLGYRILIKK